VEGLYAHACRRQKRLVLTGDTHLPRPVFLCRPNPVCLSTQCLNAKICASSVQTELYVLEIIAFAVNI